ncbi:probable inactive 2-oxoglutarate-dependent dioxygenase AOP2 [Coffea eugenioides]|uniref:probable inactive 2-oxoglutarate-dependent dioxygenase AOP2 n=1 Tax=Coffea eugenioides TaxID=49369 RepID=UPI000F60E8E6|nr:probable inactive 2-oxoglutarate-dependent dioxygenase AOP2 [Coffea eugenioides]
MDSPKLQKLPVINFGQENLQHGTKSWSLARNEVRHALEECGCFLAVYDAVSFKLRDSVFSALEKLFDLPVETKKKNTSDTLFFGYICDDRDPSIRENMGIENSTDIEEVKKFSKLMWPQGNDDNFSGIIHECANLLSELEQVVIRMVFESYGVEKLKCDSHIDSIMYVLRFNNYKAPGVDEKTVIAPPHTDKCLISILAPSQVNGLEVNLKDEQWIPVDFLPSSFVVMAGDALMAWSNDRIRPCLHRVQMNANARRSSVLMTSYHKGVVHIPQELIDEENPQRYKPFDHLEYHNFLKKELQTGQHVQFDAIKRYCGV